MFLWLWLTCRLSNSGLFWFTSRHPLIRLQSRAIYSTNHMRAQIHNPNLVLLSFGVNHGYYLRILIVSFSSFRQLVTAHNGSRALYRHLIVSKCCSVVPVTGTGTPKGINRLFLVRDTY